MQNEIGIRIGALIKELGIKKVRFAEQIKVDQSYITQLTKGRNNPSDRLISDICRQYNVNETWLRTGEGDMFTTVPKLQIDELIAELGLNEVAGRIMHGYFALDETDRSIIKRLIEVCVGNSPQRVKGTTNEDCDHREIMARNDVETISTKSESITFSDMEKRLAKLEHQCQELSRENEQLKKLLREESSSGNAWTGSDAG